MSRYGQYDALCMRHFEKTTVVFDADDSLHVIMLWFSCDLIVKINDLIVFQYNYHRCFKTC